MRKCAFCNREAELTREHIWSDWIGRSFPKNRRYLMSTHDAKGDVKTWEKSELNEKTRIVCSDCNNGWMSRLENSAKPLLENMILRGSPLSIFPTGSYTVACFAFKNAVITDQMSKDRALFYSESERKAFKEDLALPKDFHVWLATYPRHRGLFDGYYSEAPAQERDRFRLHVLTYGAGYLVLQAVGFKWISRNQRRHRQAPNLVQGPTFQSVSAPLWPSNGRSVMWPPENDLVDKTTTRYLDRWRRVVASYAPHNRSEMIELQSS
jgi:hypothetical protein